MNKNFFKYNEYDTYPLLDFGFKIHISSTIHNYKKILKIVLPFLRNEKVAFKYIYKDEYIIQNYSVNEEPSESGKLITIYPKDLIHFKFLLEELYKIIPKNEQGIYILSDRSYKDSNNIFYRYGTMKLNYKKTYQGYPTIVGPNGRKWQDYQKSYFDIPEWIDDIQDEVLYEDSYLSEKYSVKEVIKYSNGGNIYSGVDMNNKKIVLKESRPHILAYNKYLKRMNRVHEYLLTGKLKKYVAKPIEVVDEWINKYYIYELVEGKNLYNDLIKYSVFKFNTNSPSKNCNSLENFILKIKCLLELIKYFHSENVVLNDIHPDNFIVDNSEIFFIDLENSYIYGDKPKFGIYNDVCIPDWNILDGKKADVKKIGNLILFTISKLHIKTENEIYENLYILDNILKVYGVNTNITWFIKTLLIENLSIDEAIINIDKVYISIYDKSIKLNTINYIPDRINFNFDNYKYMEEFRSIFDEYNFEDEAQTKFMIDKENKLGLFGLSGILLNLHDLDFLESKRDKIIDYGLNKIIEKLIVYKNNKIVPIKYYAGSPYISNGSCGLIKLLIKVDYIKYKNLIIELSENLLLEFAQNPSYFDGMLGIADTLIDVYSITTEKKYLYYSKSLLLNSLFYLKYGKISFDEYFYVYNKLSREINYENISK